MCPLVLRQVGASNGQFSESTGGGMQGRNEMHPQRETDLGSVSGRPCLGCTGLERENSCPAFKAAPGKKQRPRQYRGIGPSTGGVGSNVSWVHIDGAAHLKILRDRIKGDQRKEYGN